VVCKKDSRQGFFKPEYVIEIKGIRSDAFFQDALTKEMGLIVSSNPRSKAIGTRHRTLVTVTSRGTVGNRARRGGAWFSVICWRW
jgi:hypothetical protein